jgi:YesN/AraC family two-component response regulator
MSDLSEIHSMDVLAGWLARTLEHMMDAIEKNRRRDPGSMLNETMRYLDRHYAEPISRDAVAKAVHVSPSHFSYLIGKESGATFTALLNRIRVDRAAELLAREAIKVSEVALRSGFTDQSYFTKVFKRYRKLTPHRYRVGLGARARTG